jgi:hypothetical protein
VADKRTIRRTLAEQAHVPGLNCYPSTPSNGHSPLLIVVDNGDDPFISFGSAAARNFSRHDFELLVGVAMNAPPEVVQEALDEYKSSTGAKSVVAALLGDTTLGGIGRLTFGTWTASDVEEIGGSDHWTARLPVSFWA